MSHGQWYAEVGQWYEERESQAEEAAARQIEADQYRAGIESKWPSVKLWPGKTTPEGTKMNNENMGLWNRVCVTDPKAVKPITGKQYKGNSPKPYWIVQRLTEEFGPCGIGWGFSVINERFERFGETESLHIALVSFWYVIDGKKGEFQQMGQTRSSYVTSSDRFMVDEDAPKKSVTDALVKCASYIGFAGDIFSGRWDDSKYVAWARDQYEEPAKPGPQIAASVRSSATMGEMETLPPEEQQYIRELALEVLAMARDDAPAAVARIEAEKLEDTQKMSLWALLDSKTRAAIKKAQATMKEAVAA